jgi:ornithine carbamoyltransferase
MKKDFISIADYSRQELNQILDLAIYLKKEWKSGGNQQIFKGKTLAMIFQKPSLRTRISFDMAMRHFGGDALYISPNEVGLGKRESVGDVAQVLSGYVDAIMARVFEHSHVVELAKYATIPVINGLSDWDHPCQGMTDVMTIIEKFGTFEGINFTFVGDGNNMALTLMQICSKLGANFTIANPEGYDLPAQAIERCKGFAKETGSKLTFIRDPHDAVKNADVIYTDSWISMGQEDQADAREKAFPPYQVNAKLVAEARSNAIVMHCLPAHRNHELTDEVADGPQSVIFPQAHNRLHAQKAILVWLLHTKH